MQFIRGLSWCIIYKKVDSSVSILSIFDYLLSKHVTQVETYNHCTWLKAMSLINVTSKTKRVFCKCFMHASVVCCVNGLATLHNNKLLDIKNYINGMVTMNSDSSSNVHISHFTLSPWHRTGPKHLLAKLILSNTLLTDKCNMALTKQLNLKSFLK